MAKKKLENMTDEELDQEHQEAMTAVEEARKEAASVQTERDRRAMEAKIAALSDEEKRALAQHIKTEGIQSEEA